VAGRVRVGRSVGLRPVRAGLELVPATAGAGSGVVAVAAGTGRRAAGEARPAAAEDAALVEVLGQVLEHVVGLLLRELAVLDRGDIEEAVSTALAVGDFDVSSANHHGTPQERRAAWLTGFKSGDPSSCRRFVPAT